MGQLMKRYKKHVTRTEKVGPTLIGVLLAIAIVAQLFFNCVVLPLIMLLGVCLAILLGLIFLPEFYELHRNDLVIVNPLLSSNLHISYDEILYIDTIGLFRRVKRDMDAVEVVLKYRPSGKKMIRTVCCHPKNVTDFVKELQERCPNLIPYID